MAREICVDLPKAEKNVNGHENPSVALMTGTVLYLPLIEPGGIDGENGEISTEEFAHPALPQSLPTFGPVPPVSETDVEEAIKRIKSGKATGPDDIASELWKAKNCDPKLWLREFFNRVIQEGSTPSDWQESINMEKER